MHGLGFGHRESMIVNPASGSIHMMSGMNEVLIVREFQNEVIGKK